MSSPDAAELSKLLENVFRNVNIAFVNNLALLCERMGLDVWEVINAAATKPFGFMKFTPGPGVGGHCIPVDPYYLAWRAREFDFIDRFIELAGDINFAMPRHVVDLVAEASNDRGQAVKGAQGRRPRGRLQAERPRCPQLAGRRRHRRHRRSWRRRPLPRSARPLVQGRPGGRARERRTSMTLLAWADAIVIVTPHAAIDWDRTFERAALIVDTVDASHGRQYPTPPGPAPGRRMVGDANLSVGPHRIPSRRGASD